MMTSYMSTNMSLIILLFCQSLTVSSRQRLERLKFSMDAAKTYWMKNVDLFNVLKHIPYIIKV